MNALRTLNCIVICCFILIVCQSCGGNKGVDINITVEAPKKEFLLGLSNNNLDPEFQAALDVTDSVCKNSDMDYFEAFLRAWSWNYPEKGMAPIFSVGLKQAINEGSSNTEVIAQIRKEYLAAMSYAVSVLEKRLEKAPVSDYEINFLEATGRIMIDLEGVEDQNRVFRIIQARGNLEFWETYDYKEVYSYMSAADSIIAIRIRENEPQIDTADFPGDTSSNGQYSQAQFERLHPLFALLMPALRQDEGGNYFPDDGPAVGYCLNKDTAKVNALLAFQEVLAVFPADLKLAWTVRPTSELDTTLRLIALKGNVNGGASLNGSTIVEAKSEQGSNGGNEILMTMNDQGAVLWKKMTASNIGRTIAIVVDDYVYSYPRVMAEIPGGRSSISGNFTEDEARDLANVINAGMLHLVLRITEVKEGKK